MRTMMLVSYFLGLVAPNRVNTEAPAQFIFTPKPIPTINFAITEKHNREEKLLEVSYLTVERAPMAALLGGLARKRKSTTFVETKNFSFLLETL